ncbi:Glycosyltransferase involved in cell wall bisynthesis [Butyrivibrio proteoclasticus]|uniref:Glycosyltransferase involved in cell wall bisynthesis n=1 Tax=Butyrivibrio proteoclasticus TaxID=43305 RepID=A0A1I5W3S1_9FIRM|nr:glycosyltransferase [Butyrivibrio proteoclasticus]SFQ14369.1 Glycosyltransferase involved in cell wall bisynthesis [Butyrivibrio proteoclasticus]
MITPIIIPAYEPDEKLIKLVDELNSALVRPIIVVNDGSDKERFGHVFKSVKERGAIVLEHAVNMGKGRALKTAFNYCLNEYEDLAGVITADSDGQHTVSDIKKCKGALLADSGALVLGVRNFDEGGIPARSVFGNKLTRMIMKLLVGLSISDTQTGLRGIGTCFMKYLLTEDGERFEFETNMLIATKDQGINIIEVPISTIYLEENKSSHFNPIVDSIRIYAIFLKFLFSSLSSSVVDIVMFSIFCAIFRNVPTAIGYIMLSTILARIISAIYNFAINYGIVFKGKGSKINAAIKYFALAVCIMLLSGFFVTIGHGLFGDVPEIVVKVPVDCLLFLLSFIVQREIVYK